MQKFDLVIVGGGLAGASLAVALRNTRLSIALVESRAPGRPQGWDARIYAVNPANAAFLEKIGVWKHLDPTRICPIHGMEVRGDHGAKLDFSAYETGVSELAWILESSLMASELWENLKRQSNVTLFCPSQPAALESRIDAAVLKLQGGETLAARLLVGADGRDSWVRGESGLAAETKFYGEKGVVANFACAKFHRNIAFQWFRDDGVLAWLPLPGNRISIVWATPDANADYLCNLPADALARRVADAGFNSLGSLETITAPQAFPLRLVRVPRTIAPRLALIGDAAHGIHPLSGHGINLGFQDACELAAILSSSQPWLDIGDERFLRRYERARKEETLLMQTTTDLLRRLFAASAPGLAPLRNLGLGLTNALPIAKTTLVRYALGSL
ncbi:MAG: UbiH/UbiF family hydroxylase [Betaproteobacteria bacterium]